MDSTVATDTHTPARTLARVVVAALMTVVTAGSWDVWWHAALGRDTFWEPPHVLLQVGVAAALVAAAAGWWRSRDPRLRWLVAAALLVPLSAPFDEIWHRVFGVEDLRSPLVVWSLPHVTLVAGLIAVDIVALRLLRRDPDPVARFLFMGMAGGALLLLLLFLAAPLELLGPYHVVGPAGEAIPALFLALVLLAMRAQIAGPGGAMISAAFFLVLSAISTEPRVPAPGVLIPPHEHPPIWLSIFSYVLPAAFADLAGGRTSPALIGAGIGFLQTGFLYGTANLFLEPSFRYSVAAGAASMAAGVVGGAVGGVLSRPLSRQL